MALTVNIPITQAEVDAAELEGFHVATKEQIAKVKRIDTLQDRKDALDDELKRLKAELVSDLHEVDGKVLTRFGKAIVRISTFTVKKLNSSLLREEQPELAAKYTVEAIQTRVTVGL